MLFLSSAPPLPWRYRFRISPKSPSRFTCCLLKLEEFLIFRILAVHPRVTGPDNGLLESIFRKLGVTTRAVAVAHALNTRISR